MEGRVTVDYCLLNLKVLVDEAMVIIAHNGMVAHGSVTLAKKLKDIVSFSLNAYEKHTGIHWTTLLTEDERRQITEEFLLRGTKLEVSVAREAASFYESNMK
jgi:hypothetical protein